MIVFIGWTADYDRIMIQQLREYFEIKNIAYPEGRLFFRLNKITKFNLVRLFLKLHSLAFPPDAILIFKDSDGYGYHRHLDLFKQKKILIIRNIITSELALFFKDSFDEVHSFDKAQCDKYEFKYMRQIFPLSHVYKNGSLANDSCYFVGLDKNRLSIIDSIGQALSYHGIKPSFFVIKDKTSYKHSGFYSNCAISYKENINKVQESKYILEVNTVGQVGLTLRSLESIFYSRKLISNNIELMNCDFYDKSRIFIFNNPNDLFSSDFDEFIRLPYKPVENVILEKYKASNIFKKLT